jgi:hypothetical protein
MFRRTVRIDGKRRRQDPTINEASNITSVSTHGMPRVLRALGLQSTLQGDPEDEPEGGAQDGPEGTGGGGLDRDHPAQLSAPQSDGAQKGARQEHDGAEDCKRPTSGR